MYIPTCAVEIVNNDCPTGWVFKYVSDVYLSTSDLKLLIGASIAPLATAYVFRQIRISIQRD